SLASDNDNEWDDEPWQPIEKDRLFDESRCVLDHDDHRRSLDKAVFFDWLPWLIIPFVIVV
ncbi:MAG: hypothetical protein AAFV59_06355, partial [Pseudomonadota bacterium]